MSNIYDSSISIWANWIDISNRCKSWIRFYKANKWIVKFNASATACITTVSAPVP